MYEFDHRCADIRADSGHHFSMSRHRRPEALPARPTIIKNRLAVAVVVLVVALVSAPMAKFAVPAQDMALLAVFGIFQMGLALIMFTTGIRLIPSADAGLISVLEAVLAPIWVWLVFREDPGTLTLIGGAVVIAAVTWAATAERR